MYYLNFVACRVQGDLDKQSSCSAKQTSLDKLMAKQSCLDKQSSCSAKQSCLDKQMAKQSCLDKQMGLDDQMFGKTDDLFICCPERYSFFKRILEYYVDPHPLSFLMPY